MPQTVKADIIVLLRHLVQALQPIARQAQIRLSFQPHEKKLCIGYFPDLVSGDVISILCNMISFTPKNHSILVSTKFVNDPAKSFLTISFCNTGICLLPLGEISLKCKLPLIMKANGSGTVYELEINNEIRESENESPSVSPPVNGKLLPAYYDEIRKRLRPHLTRAESLVASLSSRQPREAVFLKRINACIFENLEEDGFDANRLSEEMHLSRAQLFRRLKPLIRQAPGSYIKTVRLEKAKELLETTDLRVGEVAFKTGFQTQSHFTRVFVKHYGVKPSLFCQQNKNATNG
ncbi:MAG TPA: AraC family transcriptional regulator [Puia sp.]|nr:AraC family transcriptional regulator [Puia sp.]